MAKSQHIYIVIFFLEPRNDENLPKSREVFFLLRIFLSKLFLSTIVWTTMFLTFKFYQNVYACKNLTNLVSKAFRIVTENFSQINGQSFLKPSKAHIKTSCFKGFRKHSLTPRWKYPARGLSTIYPRLSLCAFSW